MPNRSFKNKRRRPNNRARNQARPRKLHLVSRVETVVTLKQQPKKREVYPIPVSDIFNVASIGADTDIRAVGYTIDLDVATGNRTNTCSFNISHSGNWVRRAATNDGFNQQFRAKRLTATGHCRFSKRVLPQSEREFISPHKDPTCSLDIQVDDPCGVIPGASIKVTATINFVRPHVPTLLVGSADLAQDLYEDQDVSAGGAGPAPPSSTNDVPVKMQEYGGVMGDAQYRLSKEDSPLGPFTYTPYTVGTFSKIVVTVPSATKINRTGVFVFNAVGDPSSRLQSYYTDEKYEGNIVGTKSS